MGHRCRKEQPTAKNRAKSWFLVFSKNPRSFHTLAFSHSVSLSPLHNSQPTFSFVCLCAEPDPAAPADNWPGSGPEPAADSSPAGPLPAELCSNQRHRRSHGGHHCSATARSGPGATQQETSDRTLWGLLRHWGATVRLPGQYNIIEQTPTPTFSGETVHLSVL